MEHMNMFETLEKALDSIFGIPGKFFHKLGNGFFEYTYRETENGVFGLFNSPEKLKAAAKAAHAKGYSNFDCFSPFPIHGLEHDMGLNRSKLPYITLVFGLIGLATGFSMQYIIHEQIIGFKALTVLNSYPLNIGGKPSFSWPAMVPVMFELTILFGGISTVVGFLGLSGLPKASRRPLHLDLTNDRFALWVPTDSANYSEAGVKQLLTELGASEITVVEDFK
jgi:hypothetical protein